MEARQNFVPRNNENVISRLWEKYFPYWPGFILLIGIAAGSAWLYLRFNPPVYESTATLLIKDEKKGTADSKMMESLNLLSTKKIIENEIQVIKSKALMRQVIHELQLYAPIFADGNWKDLSAYTTSPVTIEVQNADSLVEIKRVDFSYHPTKRMVNLNGHDYSLNEWISTPWGTIRFAEVNRSQLSAGPFYFALVNTKRVARKIMKDFEVSTSGKLSSVINLKLTDEVPQRSEDILNSLIAAYDKASVDDKNMLAKNTLSFLDERLQYVSGDLDSIEKKLQQYRARKGAIDISSQGKLFLENVSANDQKLSDVNMKLAMLRQVEQYVSSNDNRGGLVPSTLGIDDPLLTNLLDKLYDTELQYEKLKRTTGENNPQLTSLADRIEKIKPGVLENIRSQQLSLEANKRNLFSTNNSYATLLQALPQQERDLVEISREQNTKSSIYGFLLQKREETALSNSSTLSDTRVVDKAESSLDPVGLGKIFIYVIAVIFALGLGISLVTARELFNRTILYRKEIEQESSFPVIGEIEMERSKKPLVIEQGKASLIAEEFRLLRTSLFYTGIVSGGKVFLITSTIAGEGKSFVAANLAISLASSGKKVILVEFDLSNPTLAIKLNMAGGKGVADFLSGNAEAEDVIRSTGYNANLFIITAGSLPENPSELILHERTAALLQYLRNRFDYVVVDSAPVGILSDGYVLSRYCDTTLFVVRHRYTPKKALVRLEQNNKINELKNLSIVFNGVRTRGFGSSGNGYGYGYGYGYIYKQKQLARNN